MDFLRSRGGGPAEPEIHRRERRSASGTRCGALAIIGSVPGPSHLFDVWNQVAPGIADPLRVVLFADFDGTIAHIRRRPSDVVPAPGIRPVLAEFARHGALAGVISGRPLGFVSRAVGVRGLWYAGEHGHFFLAPNGTKVLSQVSPTECARMKHVGAQLARTLAGVPGVIVERKGASVAVHYRGAPRSSLGPAKSAVDRMLDAEPDLRLISGRKIWELVAAGTVDKWSAVRFVLRHAPRRRRTLIFLGDDVTDEAVFRRMRGISVFVGSEGGATAARYWLRSPVEVREFLERCVRLWERRDRLRGKRAG